MQPTILLIEDEQSIADVVIYNLRKEGYNVQWERDGRGGLARAQTLLPDLVVLDLMLPGIDGLEDITHEFWQKRYQQINRFEKNLAENGVVIIKIFLHLSSHLKSREGDYKLLCKSDPS